MHERDHRLTLLGRVRSALAEAGVPHALIGAAALALYGVSRSTYDIDLLATERSCLDQAFRAPLSASGAVLEVRKGDLDDPLAGVVRFTEPAERPVDLIVGKARWQAEALARAESRIFAEVELPVLRAPDFQAGGAGRRLVEHRQDAYQEHDDCDGARQSLGPIHRWRPCVFLRGVVGSSGSCRTSMIHDPSCTLSRHDR